MPIAFSCNIGPLNSLLRISGVIWSYNSSKAFFKNNLKHFPFAYLPALPDLCKALALDTGTIERTSIIFNGSYTLIFITPLSITYLTPLMVTLVSAMFVARITLRGGFSPFYGTNISCWYYDGRAEYNINGLKFVMLNCYFVFSIFLYKVLISS